MTREAGRRGRRLREVHRPTDLPTRLWQHGRNPVADGSQFTVDVAWHTYRKLRDPKLLDKKVLDKLVKTMESVPRNAKTRLVHIKPGGWDRCPYGFTDSVRKQGDVLFSSLLYVQACRQLADLMDAAKIPEEPKKWRREAEQLSTAIRETFWDDKIGLFLRRHHPLQGAGHLGFGLRRVS